VLKNENVATKHSLENPLHLLACNLCGLKFEENWQVMAHRKLKHKENVKVYKYLIKRVSEISDQPCWLRQTDAAFGPQTFTVFK
jgi:hypothetical protein